MAAGNYNFIYRQLVDDDNDILGIIAYSLYKRQKIEFIENFKKKYGQEPQEADFKSFNEFSSSDLQLNSYINEASALAKTFLDSSLAEEAAVLDKQYSDESTAKIKAAKPSFWFGVWQGVVASFIFVILVGILVFFTWSLKQGPRQAIESIFAVTITDAEIAAAK